MKDAFTSEIESFSTKITNLIRQGSDVQMKNKQLFIATLEETRVNS